MIERERRYRTERPREEEETEERGGAPAWYSVEAAPSVNGGQVRTRLGCSGHVDGLRGEVGQELLGDCGDAGRWIRLGSDCVGLREDGWDGGIGGWRAWGSRGMCRMAAVGGGVGGGRAAGECGVSVLASSRGLICLRGLATGFYYLANPLTFCRVRLPY
ncbi:hypothetical protein ZWY2020_028585 [Hordeum vulgare]|nr:hypothetical protein ZWY2020_028585 [Hordeum vulgare]